jgi:hypothetical protein
MDPHPPRAGTDPRRMRGVGVPIRRHTDMPEHRDKGEEYVYVKPDNSDCGGADRRGYRCRFYYQYKE